MANNITMGAFFVFKWYMNFGIFWQTKLNTKDLT